MLLGHSLGALAALRFCELRADLVRRLVLVDPPGSASTDFGEVARGVEAQTARAEEAPEAAVRELLAENPVGRRGRPQRGGGPPRLRR